MGLTVRQGAKIAFRCFSLCPVKLKTGFGRKKVFAEKVT